MDKMKQFGRILIVTCIGELLKYLLPLPVPGSIYGLLVLFMLLVFRVIKLEQVKDAAEFLIEIMPLMFIPAAVGLIDSWNLIQSLLIPLLVIVPVTTALVIFVTGKVTDKMMEGKEDGCE